MWRNRRPLPAVLLVLYFTACSGSSPGSTVDFSNSPAISPGGLGNGTVTIDGTDIEYFTIVPDSFELGDTAPAMFAFPPGSQDESITQQVAVDVYQAEAVKRGWVVFTPVAPGGETFFDGSEQFVPGLLEWLNTWVEPEGGTPHVVGVRNGGLSAFRVVAQQPDAFASILVFPGYPFSDGDRVALETVDIPVRMFVGAEDPAWVDRMEDTFVELSDRGSDVTYTAFPGEGHRVVSLSDGVRIFDELDALR